MAWDPQMMYGVPFWQEPRLRRPTGQARTWRWRHNPSDEPGARNLFYGSALMNSFDRALAGSDRLDPPGWSRLVRSLSLSSHRLCPVHVEYLRLQPVLAILLLHATAL